MVCLFRPPLHGLGILPIADEDAVPSIPEGFEAELALHGFRQGHHLGHRFGIAGRVQGPLGNEDAGIMSGLKPDPVVDGGHAVKVAHPIFTT